MLISRIIFFLCLLVLTASELKADTFVVTSNAETGPGTLHDAITRANANGTTVKDYIHFNLTNVTITLNNDLPALTSNIVIDGSTQPGPALGVSGAKVILLRVVPYLESSPFYGLCITDAGHVEIYGLVIKKQANGSGYMHAIRLMNAEDIIIGAPGKGNVMQGFRSGIASWDDKPNKNITIQSNIIGLEPDGKTLIPGYALFAAVEMASSTTNILIGGADAAHGNLIHGNYRSIYLVPASGDVTLRHNIIGTDISGTMDYGMSQGPKVTINGDPLSPTNPVIIEDNLITGGSRDALACFGLENGFVVKRNKIGSDVTGARKLGSRLYGMTFSYCGPGLIGGSLADENIVTGCTSAGVILANCYSGTVSQNRMFCNGENLYNNWYPAPPPGITDPFIRVEACDGNTMSGSAPPNSKIEVFLPYRCRGSEQCDGKDYIGFIYADASGKWSYLLNGLDGAIFTATDETGATSMYSSPYVDIIVSNIIGADCGKSNGSIPVNLLYNGVPFHWEDEAGNIVGRDASLVNVPAGKYRLAMYGGGCSKPECIRYYEYEIPDESPKIHYGPNAVTNASCGEQNGSVEVGVSGGNLSFRWHTADNRLVGSQQWLGDVGPGEYYLTIRDEVRLCSATEGPFIVTNTSGPTLDESGVVIQDASCAKPVGSIKGLLVTGTGAIQYTWKDEAGNIVGNTADITGLYAGKYTLHFNDASACRPQSPVYEIKETGNISVGMGVMVITPADCRNMNGSITGVEQVGGTAFEWTNAAGQVVSTSLAATQLSEGAYRLKVSNTTGCEINAGPFTVGKTVGQAPQLTVVLDRPSSCVRTDGSIHVTPNTGTAVAYQWEDATGALAGSGKELNNVVAGTYKLIIRDAQQCTYEYQYTLVELLPPSIDIRQVQVMRDECGAGIGAIRHVGAGGVPPMTFSWRKNGVEVSNELQPSGLYEGDYVLHVKDGKGCETFSQPVRVSNLELFPALEPVPDITIVKGMNVPIDVSAAGDGIYSLYFPGMNFPLTNTTGKFVVPGVMQNTTFTIIFRKGGCASPPLSVFVKVVDEVKIIVPTAFSPNGDGVNDLFRLKAFGLASLEFFTVHDRWGNRIFYTQNPNIAWDGHVNRQRVPVGSYVWALKGKDITGAVIQRQGVVTVVF